MTQLMAFTKKEWMEMLRTGKFAIITVLFILFGVMNPAIAKLTPWMMETLSESLESTGLTITETKVDALTSWVQFYKNIPMALIVFLLMFSGILAVEYRGRGVRRPLPGQPFPAVRLWELSPGHFLQLF